MVLTFGRQDRFLNHRLAVAADHFQISETTLPITKSGVQHGQSTTPLSMKTRPITFRGQRHRWITRDLSAIFSLANMQFRDAGPAVGCAYSDNMAISAQLPLLPRCAEGANVFVECKHNGSVAGENAPNLASLHSASPKQVGLLQSRLGPRHAGCQLSVEKNYSFNLNVANVFLNQKVLVQTPASRSVGMAPIQPGAFDWP